MSYKISIIIPVYRVENYISRCCRSLFGMRFQDVEYLFVDDATPDGSIAVIESVLNEYPHRKAQVRLLTHQKNMGLPAPVIPDSKRLPANTSHLSMRTTG